jgi:hypothetical protein
MGGGIVILGANAGDANKIQASANNSIIWGNTALSYPNIYNPTKSRLKLDFSLAQDGNYDGTGISFSGDPFASSGDYTLDTGATALINGGANNLYPDNADKLLYQADTTTPVLQDPRYTTFKTLIEAAVFNSGNIDKDAAAAQGDLYHKVIGHGENVNGVTVTNENQTASIKTRTKGTTIDVGAYEMQ